MADKVILVLSLILLFTLYGRNTNAATFLTIGDSNGASEHGWVVQLQKIYPDVRIINRSISGNTIGFDNNGDIGLNTLRKIDQYLATAVKDAKPEKIDKILICLGTNDCKAVFADSLAKVPDNMRQLIVKIRSFYNESSPEIIIVSPPPYGPDRILKEKYHGGDSRVKVLTFLLRALAKEMNCGFVDIYSVLEPVYEQYAPDGVHMKAEGQMIIAKTIQDYLDK